MNNAEKKLYHMAISTVRDFRELWTGNEFFVICCKAPARNPA